jgi:hypothetical protein
MSRFAAGLAAGIALGALAIWLAPDPNGGRASSPPGAAAGPQVDVEGDVEVSLLRAEVEELRSKLEALERGGAWDEAGVPDESAEEEAARAAAGLPTADELRALCKAPAKPWFDEEELLAFGISEREVERIRLRWEQYVMDKLRASAALEGKGHKERQRNRMALAALAQDVREDLGDGSYDAMLYASGANNRVVIADILSTSPAAEAGLQKGDEVLRYDGQRIFNPLVLQKLVKGAPQGEIVRIEILRDGIPMIYYVPLGPLGIQLAPKNKPPNLD